MFKYIIIYNLDIYVSSTELEVKWEAILSLCHHEAQELIQTKVCCYWLCSIQKAARA